MVTTIEGGLEKSHNLFLLDRFSRPTVPLSANKQIASYAILTCFTRPRVLLWDAVPCRVIARMAPQERDGRAHGVAAVASEAASPRAAAGHPGARTACSGELARGGWRCVILVSYYES